MKFISLNLSAAEDGVTKGKSLLHLVNFHYIETISKLIFKPGEIYPRNKYHNIDPSVLNKPCIQYASFKNNLYYELFETEQRRDERYDEIKNILENCG